MKFKVNDVVNVIGKPCSDSVLYSGVMVVEVDEDSQHPYRVNATMTHSFWLAEDELELCDYQDLAPQEIRPLFESDLLGNEILDMLPVDILPYAQFVNMKNELHGRSFGDKRYALTFIEYMIRTGAWYYNIPITQPKPVTVEEAPSAPQVQEKYRRLVIADYAPHEGDFEETNGQIYICTGTGKTWYCRDNSAGDSSLEGSYVCYVYFVLANDEQIAAYKAQREESAAKKLAAKQLESVEKHVRENGERVESFSGKTIYDSRTYHVGAGYGTGNVWRVSDEKLYLSHYTGSRVEEWMWRHYAIADDGKLATVVQSSANGSPVQEMPF